MLSVYVNYCKRRYLCWSNCTDSGHSLALQYAIMPDNLVFIGIDFLLPNSAYSYFRIGTNHKTIDILMTSIVANWSIRQQLLLLVCLLHSYHHWVLFVNSLGFLGWMREHLSMNKRHHPSMSARCWTWSRDRHFLPIAGINIAWMRKSAQCAL